MSRSVQPPGTIQFDAATIPAPPRSLRAFVAKLLAGEYQGRQRRAAKRLPVVVPVAAMPLDDSFRPKGEAFAAVTGDLSTAGMRMFSTRAASSEFLGVELTTRSGQNIQVVLQVLRCNAIGRFYEIAGQLVARTQY
jgi:hypothetical protein